jgi:hypothetical protein
MLLLADELSKDANTAFSIRLRRRLVDKVTEEIAQAGAGRAVPEFKQNTKQNIGPQKGTGSTNKAT